MSKTRSKTTMTKQLRDTMVQECIEDTTQIILESAIDIVNAEELEDYHLCLELHNNVINYCTDISKLHNTLLFNDAGDQNEIKNGLIKQYQFLIFKMREKRDQI
jgi:hypothetical protein